LGVSGAVALAGLDAEEKNQLLNTLRMVIHNLGGKLPRKVAASMSADIVE
jgi:hypothetical protein